MQHERGVLTPARRRWAISVTAIGALLTMADQSILNVALPTIARDVHAAAADAVWVVNAFQIALLIAMVPLSSLADIVGYRRLFRAGMLLFAAAALGCAFAQTIPQLAATRFVMAFGTASIAVATAPLMRLSFPPAMLGRATGYSAMLVAIGAAGGPVLGGALLGVTGWQSLFVIYVPVGIATFVLAGICIPDVPGRGGAFDVRSALLNAATFVPLALALGGLGHAAPAAAIASAFAVALVAGTIFVRRQLTLAHPMFAVDLFALPAFGLAVFACFASFVAQTIAFVALPFALQTLAGHPPLEVAELFLPWLIATATISPFAGRFADRIDASRLAACGLAVYALGLAALAFLPAHAGSLDIAWRMALAGCGYGFYQSPNNRAIQGSAPRERSGAPQGIQATARIFGQVTGAVLVALVFGFARGVDARSVAIALGCAVAFAAAGATASAWRASATAARPGAER